MLDSKRQFEKLARPYEKKQNNFLFLLYLFFLFEYFFRLSSRVEVIASFRPTAILIVLITLGIFTSNNSKEKAPSSNVKTILLILVGYFFISLPFVEFPKSALVNNFEAWLKALVFFFFTISIVNTRERFQKTFLIFLCLQVFRILEPLYLNLTTGYWGDSTYLGEGNFQARLAGAPHDVINPNELGFVIVFTMAYVYYIMDRKSTIHKVLFYCLLLASGYALVLTMSRGAFVVAIVFVSFAFRKSQYKFVFITFILVGLTIAWTKLDGIHKERYTSLFSDDTSFSSGRAGRINGAVHEFKLGFSKPIFGHGLGTTAEAKWNKMGYYEVSHNMYAEILIEMGMVGLWIFGLFILKLYRCIKELITLSKDDEMMKYVIAMQSVFWIYLIYSLNYWGLTQFYWYFLAGAAVSLWQILKIEAESETEILRK